LKLSIEAMEKQLADYPKIRKEARFAIIIAALSGLAALVEAAILMKQSGLL
jgi:hypothetical protein